MHKRSISGFLYLLVAACGASNGSPPPEHASEPVWTGAVDEDAFRALHQLTDLEASPLRSQMIPVGEPSGYLSW